MSFNVPTSKYGSIQNWLIETLAKIDFIKGVTIYESDFFITPSTNIPAIALQRGKLEEEDDENEKCIGENSVKTNVSITLHVPPTEKDTLDPVLYYFEETVYNEIIDEYLHGNPPSNLNYLRFIESYVSNLFDRDKDAVFSNISKVRFNIGFTV